MRKVFSIFVVVALMVSIFSGCGSSNNAGSGGGSSKQAASSGSSSSGSSGSSKSDNSGSSSQKAPGKLVFWDKAEYVPAYNKDMKAYVEKWGKDHNVKVDYVVVSPNDLKTKLMAAIEAKNPPDLIVGDDFLLKQFIQMKALTPLDDVVKAVPDLLDGAKNYTVTQGKFYLAPEAFLLGGAYLRKDIWDKHNLPVPTTWQELYKDAKIVNDPKHGFYATGLPLGASGGGDAEGMLRDVILDWGGAVVNKDNKVVVNSPQVLAALKFMAQFWQQKLTPPSSVTWDDMGNNNAYLAGTVGFVINSGSIYAALAKKPELKKNTILIPKLGGPKGKIITGGGNAFAVLNGGKGTQNAKDFIQAFLNDKKHYNALVAKMGGMWQPVLKGSDQDPFWKDPNNASSGWLSQIHHIVGAGNYPGPEDATGSKSKSMQLVTKAMQRIVVQKMDPQKSLDILEQDLKKLYNQK